MNCQAPVRKISSPSGSKAQGKVLWSLRLLKQVVNEATGEKNTGGVPSSGTSRIFLAENEVGRLFQQPV